MEGDTLTLQEAAELLGKSTQTVRRLIKRGEILAEQVQTPQGFQYAVSRASIAQRFPRLKMQREETVGPSPAFSQAPNPVPIANPKPLEERVAVRVEQEAPESFLENDYYLFEPSPVQNKVDTEAVSSRQVFELVQLAHKEKLMLITILERLQAELERERERPKTLLQWIQNGFKSVGGLFKNKI